MTNYGGAPLEEQVKKLLEQNLAYSKELYALAKKTQNYIFWGRVMNLISLLLVLAPIILGIIYLPALLGNGMSGLFSAMGITPTPEVGNLTGNAASTKELLQAVENQGGIINAYKNILEMGNNK